MPDVTFTDTMRRQLDARRGQFLAIDRAMNGRLSATLTQASLRVTDAIEYATRSDEIYLRRLRSMRAEIQAAMDDVAREMTNAIRQGTRKTAMEGAEAAALTAAATAKSLSMSLAWRADTVAISRDVLDYMARFPYGGTPLSDRVWQVTNQTMRSIFGEIHQGILLGKGPAEISRGIRQNLLDPQGTARPAGVVKALRTRARAARAAGKKDKATALFRAARERETVLPQAAPGQYRSAYKNAMRVARTETVRAYQESAVKYGQRKGWVGGFRWNAHGDACDTCLLLDGYYDKGSVPSMPHPQCVCRVENVARRAILTEKINLQHAPAGLDELGRRLHFTGVATLAARKAA